MLWPDFCMSRSKIKIIKSSRKGKAMSKEGVVGTSVSGMFVMDRHGRYRAYDDSARESDGVGECSVEGIIGKKFRDIVQNEDAIRRREAAISYVLSQWGARWVPWVQYDDVIRFKDGTLIRQTTLVTANTEDSCAVYTFRAKHQHICNVIPFQTRETRDCGRMALH